MRPYRLIYGKSYPRVFVGERQPTHISSDLSDPDSYYHDDALKLASGDVGRFVGKPLCFEHDKNNHVGKITAAWVDTEGNMRITGHVYTDTKEGTELFKEINCGKRKGLSVGYGVLRNFGKDIQEISIVDEPFFEGAEIKITASTTNNPNYKSNLAKESKNFVLELMAEELDKVNKEGSELMKHHDDVLKKNEDLQKRLAELEQKQKADTDRLKQFEAQELRQREDYAKRQLPVLNEVLAINEEQLKEENGPDATVSQEYKEALQLSFFDPAGGNIIAPIIASARRWKKERDLKKEALDRAAQLEVTVKKYTEEQGLQQAQIEASRRLHLATGTGETASPNQVSNTPVVQVNASKDFSKIFCPKAPSQQERQLYEMEYGPMDGVQIDASSTGKPFETLPQHRYLGFVPSSARNHPNGKFLFRHLLDNKFSDLRMKSNTTLDVVPD
jgi:hypothetical protein